MQRSKIVLCLSGKTIDEDLQILNKYRNWIDIAELRVDHLTNDERLYVRKFPELAGIPCILTIRRRIDGGYYLEGEASRTTLFARALAFADQDFRKNFAYIDLESDYLVPSLQDAALAFGTRVIRSYHNMTSPVQNVLELMQNMRITGYEIPKVACMPRSLSDVTDLFRQSREITEFEHILIAMGPYGLSTRILASRMGSYLTYTSPPETMEKMGNIGHIDPISLNETYNFRVVDSSSNLYGITGYPLEVTDSPLIHNKGYREHGMNAIYVPVRAQKIEEALEFAEETGMLGLSVTVPFKESVLPNLKQISAEVGEIGACNTAVKRMEDWIGYNTDAEGLQKALLEFLGVKTLVHRRVSIIGAGGAARAAAYVVKLLKGKACIFNRTVSKAKALAEQYGFKWASLGAESTDLLELYSDLIIQTTSIGMSQNKKKDTQQTEERNQQETLSEIPEKTYPVGYSPDRDPLAFYKFRGNECVYDVIYKPEKTPLLIRAEAAGCKICNGNSMLKYQAYRQFSLFTGVEYE